jgi:hypothetical protein
MSGQRPSYQNALRALGHFLDAGIYRHIILVEMPEGFILRAFQGLAPNNAAEGIELPIADIHMLIAQNYEHRHATRDLPKPPLCPTGYEDFFRSLGFDLDMAGAILIRTAELSNGILVSYTAYNADHAPQRFEDFYTRDRIERALAQGYSRRIGPKPIHQLPPSFKVARERLLP